MLTKLKVNTMAKQDWMKVLLEIMELQMKFNNDTNGECWIDGVTQDGREIDWFRCIRQEAAELVDCYNWKHWKDIDKPTDLGNARIEAVDIMHFLTSQVLVFQHENEFDDMAMAETWIDSSKLDDLTVGDLHMIENLMAATYTMDVAVCSDLFFIICERLNIGPNLMRELYVGKNTLNVFRQKNGYKEGTYVKMWDMEDGLKEDNEVLRGIMKEFPNLNHNDLLIELDLTYCLMLEK